MKKFGTFQGVFTPSILTILGVIMYLRFPSILGQMGLVNTLGIILIAHLISITTSLSLASLATDKTVKTGGTYFMISRSLGLPIGGTLGLALFVGLSFSVSLYIIGFAESFLAYFNLGQSLNSIRLTGSIMLMVITIVTFISTSLALRTQYFIMGAIVLSLLSIVFGHHEFTPTHVNLAPIANAAPFMLLFGIFFPAVTGFEAGVAMSGDLKDARKSLPLGAISAVAVGFLVYVILAFFFAFTVDANALAGDKEILFKISLVPELVVAGIWGATLSSAFGSILGAPRILQAIAMDKMTFSFFAKGTKKNNEPRNAILLTFTIALIGILIGQLDVIARVVSMFFITTYAFLNLASAIEKWSSSDFRPAFKVPGFVSITGAIAAFIVMILLDFAALAGAVVVLGLMYFYFKRKQLVLDSGDAWGSFWTNLAKRSLLKLSQGKVERRNWRPNVILFSGGEQARPHLLDIGLAITGKLGALTVFELITNGKVAHSSEIKPISEKDKKPSIQYFKRQFASDSVENGIKNITSIYGFSGFEPNTILMGWSRDVKNPGFLSGLLSDFRSKNLNALLLDYKERGFGTKSQIDIWWKGRGRELDFSLHLVRFLITDQAWQDARVRIILVNNDNTQNESLYRHTMLLLEEKRIVAEVKIIAETHGGRSREQLIVNESANADLVMMGISELDKSRMELTIEKVNRLNDLKASLLLLSPGNEFDEVNLLTSSHEELILQAEPVNLQDELNPFPKSGISFLDLKMGKLEEDLKTIANEFIHNVLDKSIQLQLSFVEQFTGAIEENLQSLEKSLSETVPSLAPKTVDKHFQSFLNFCLDFFENEGKKSSEAIRYNLDESITKYFEFSMQQVLQASPTFVVPIQRRPGGKEKKITFHYRKTLVAVVEQHLNPLLLQQLYSFNHHTVRLFTQLKKSMIRFNSIFEGFRDKSADPAELQQLKNKLKDELAVMSRMMVKQKSTHRLSIYSLIRDNIIMLSGMLLKRDAKWQLRRYINKNHNKVDEDLTAYTEAWIERNTVLNNAVFLDAQVVWLQTMTMAIVRKYHEKLQQTVSVCLLQPMEMMMQNIDLGLADHTQQWREVDFSGKLTVLSSYQDSFTRIVELQQRLPELIRISYITYEQTSTANTRAQYRISDVEPVKIASYFLDTRFNEPFLRELTRFDEILRQITLDNREANSLMWFRLENWQKDSEISQSEVEITHFLSEIKSQLIDERQRILKNMEQLRLKTEGLVTDAISPLYSHAIIQSAEKISTLLRSQKGRKFSIKFNEKLGRVKTRLNNLIVGLLYSSSDGLLLAKKYFRKKENPKTSIQQILDIVEREKPDKKVLARLPVFYRTLFSSKSLINDDFLVPLPHEMQAIQNAVRRHREGIGGAILIVGVHGSGKSTLLRFAVKRFFKKDRTFFIKPLLPGQVLSKAWRNNLQQVLGGDGSSDILHILPVDSVVVIDDLELWWERSDDGLAVIKEIAELIRIFGRKVMFVLSSNTFAYQQINRTLPVEDFFVAVVECRAFDTKKIQQLILQRHKSSGFTFHYKGTSEQSILPLRMAALFHALFNYSQGVPRVAMNAWLNSIEKSAPKNIYISRPALPDIENFNNLDKDWLVVIGLFVQHKNMSVDKLARVMKLTSHESERMIETFVNAGLLESTEQGSYCLNRFIEPFLNEICINHGLI